MSTSWKAVVEQKQSARATAIAKVQKLLEAEDGAAAQDAQYLNATATKIVKKIESEEWTAKAVVSAYIRQAIRAQEATNCLTEILFEQALEEAAALDAEFASTKKLRGTLHGVPVSFKDLFEIAGYDASIGFTQWSNAPCTSDAQLVKQLREAGAIIIAKTNVPQTMLSIECSNPVWGRTTNPWSKDHTCGGSSGGESALLALSGSALGVGTDIGGSLRIPAGYTGIYSLKPSQWRVSTSGARDPNPGFEAVVAVAGPMGRSVEDVESGARAMFGSSGATHEVLPPVPYRDVTLPQTLRFGYYTSDLLCKASPASKRAVLETVEALRKQGHECVEFEPTLAGEAFNLFVGLSSADGYKNLKSPLGPDPIESSLFLATLGPKLPSFLRHIATWVIRNIVGDAIFASGIGSSYVKSTSEFFKLTAERNVLRKKWYDEVWTKYGFDAIIAPVQATPAIPHGAASTLSPVAVATFIYNIIDSPVGVIPVTRVDPSEDQITEEWTNEAGHGSKLVELSVYSGKNAPYNPEKMKGLPVGVQIVGKTFEDEKVVAMMKIVDDALGPRSFGPTAWERKSE